MNRWIPRIAAACTGLQLGLVVQAATASRWVLVAASLPGAVFAASWWVTARRLADIEKGGKP